jgi:hypothetical protein
MRSRDFQRLLPWNDWAHALYPLVRSLFPFSLIEPGDTVVQVGANRNSIAAGGASQPLLLGTIVGPTGRAVAIESERVNVEAYERIKEQAGIPWLETLMYAVSDRSGEISGIDVDGHTFFWDPSKKGDEPVSRDTHAELKELWDHVDQGGVAVTESSERLDKILSSINAKPSFVNLTINGYEPTGIRGMGELLKSDVIISFVARATEAFWDEGILEELEALGFTLVLANVPHGPTDTWFPYIVAMRAPHLARCGALIPGRFDVDPKEHVITFHDEQGTRIF